MGEVRLRKIFKKIFLLMSKMNAMKLFYEIFLFPSIPGYYLSGSGYLRVCSGYLTTSSGYLRVRSGSTKTPSL